MSNTTEVYGWMRMLPQQTPNVNNTISFDTTSAQITPGVTVAADGFTLVAAGAYKVNFNFQFPAGQTNNPILVFDVSLTGYSANYPTTSTQEWVVGDFIINANAGSKIRFINPEQMSLTRGQCFVQLLNLS